MTEGRLAGKCAVVTGAASGIGLASARRFSAEGARVCIWDRDEAGIAHAVGELKETGAWVNGTVVDIADSASVAEATRQTLAELGEVTLLMNNAGVLDDYAPILDTDEAMWDRVVGINLKGAYLVTRALLPSMLAAGGGVIVNTASIAGIVAGGGGTAYTAAKHGVIGLTRQLAFDYGKLGIRANAIAPGAVETGMTKALFDAGDAEVMDAVRAVPAGRQPCPVPGQ
jgi:3-oxoacyl-[acyl-carrier protein] reductase